MYDVIVGRRAVASEAGRLVQVVSKTCKGKQKTNI